MIIERESDRNGDSGDRNKEAMRLVVRTIVW